MDIVPGLERLGQEERLEFKAYPGYIGNSRATERGRVSKTNKNKPHHFWWSPSVTYITSLMYRSQGLTAA